MAHCLSWNSELVETGEELHCRDMRAHGAHLMLKEEVDADEIANVLSHVGRVFL